MIDLKSAIGELVFLQLRHPTYVVIKQDAILMPMEEFQVQNGQPVPTGKVIQLDYLVGKLEKIDDSYAIQYVEPASRAKIRVLLDVDMVAFCFFEQRTTIVTPDGAST